jgi:FixJ family two-component response regulator
MSDPFRIAVVDDDVAVREGAALVVDTDGRTVETFENGEDFLRAATGGQRWDLVFLDLKMPGKTGFEVLRALPLENGKLPFPILMVSAHGDISAAVQAMRLGAYGFIEKPFTAEELEQAIAEVQASGGEGVSERRETLLEKLTPREREVAERLDRGLTNKEIARELDCSPRTIEIHRARVFEKLEVRNVAALVRILASG